MCECTDESVVFVQVFARKETLYKHICHANSADNPREKYPCKRCDKVMCSYNQLKKHESKHRHEDSASKLQSIITLFYLLLLKRFKSVRFKHFMCTNYFESSILSWNVPYVEDCLNYGLKLIKEKTFQYTVL